MDDDLILDAEEDIKIAEFVKAYLPQEVKPRFSDDDILYFMDLLGEYFAESGMLDGTDGTDDPDEDIDIDIDAAAEALASKARKEKYGDFAADDIAWIIQAELEYGDDN
jgi:hypothetical protein